MSNLNLNATVERREQKDLTEGMSAFSLVKLMFSGKKTFKEKKEIYYKHRVKEACIAEIKYLNNKRYYLIEKNKKKIEKIENKRIPTFNQIQWRDCGYDQTDIGRKIIQPLQVEISEIEARMAELFDMMHNQ